MSARAIVAAGLAALVACARGGEPSTNGPLLRAVHESGPYAVPWAVRFSFPAAPCEPADTGRFGGISCIETPSRPTPESLADIAGRAAAELREGVNEDALHAATLIDLVSGRPTPEMLERAATRLDQVIRLAPHSASAYVNLSAVLLVQARMRHDPALILRALDVASEGVRLDSSSAGALFNRALALELFALDHEAASAWQAYLGSESDASWRRSGEVASRRISAIEHAPVLTSSASPDSLRVVARRFPAEARGLAWERLLGEWGAAVISGDSGTASQRFTAAAAVAETIESTFGDVTLAQAVDAIRRSAGSPRERRLADHHARYAQALSLTRASRHAAADSVYASLLADPTISAPFRLVVTQAHANALSYAGRIDEAIGIGESLVRRVAAEEHPSLVGRTQWLLAMITVRRGENDAGARHLEFARIAYARASDMENVGAVTSVAGEIAKRNGDDLTGFLKLHEGLHALRSYPGGTWRHNSLIVLAGMSARAGFRHATAAIEREDVEGILRSGLPVSIAEATVVRADSKQRSGDRQAAEAILDSARRLIERLPPEPRRQIGAEADLLSASLVTGVDARRAQALLDSVVSELGTGNAQKLARALVARARTHLALGAADAAEADLTRAADLYDATRRATENLSQRATLLASAREVVDQLVSARISVGRARDALLALERGRIAFSSRGAAESTAEIQFPQDAVALDFAVIGDSIVAWVIEHDTISMSVTPVRQPDLVEVTNRVRAGLELRVNDAAIRKDLARLHDWLIAPIAKQLASSEDRVVIIADRELGDVPFAALYDKESGRYFIESRPLSYAGTLREAATRAAPPSRAARALIVSADADPGSFPELAPLPAAEAEVGAITDLYDARHVVRHGQLVPGYLTSALASASVFHFAGHAVFDDVRPDQSRLIIGSGALTSGAIASMDLRRLRLVVLSACQTVRVAERRGSGMAGLAEAFLAAGAGGVVGSLWRVDDAATSRLMRAFHTEYVRTGDAAGSLQSAQRQLLQSSSMHERSPATWAAFRYIGLN